MKHELMQKDWERRQRPRSASQAHALAELCKSVSHAQPCSFNQSTDKACHCPCALRGLAALAVSTLACRQVVRTFDLEENGFTGVFPLWLVQVLAASAVPVVAELDVRSSAAPQV